MMKIGIGIIFLIVRVCTKYKNYFHLEIASYRFDTCLDVLRMSETQSMGINFHFITLLF